MFGQFLSYDAFRKFLFRFDPENVHNIAEIFFRRIAPIWLVQEILSKTFCRSSEMLENEICGMKFYNPIGLAAGFDKNATMTRGLSVLGFGFLEVGTITKNSQEGNPKPRVFRHIEEESIQNAMGFNNEGAQKVALRLKGIYPYTLPIGVNLGKNKNTPHNNALKDYQEALEVFLDIGDYYVFNLSSPNTPNLRDLQNVSFVEELICMAKIHTNKPVFLKISPDMEISFMLEVCQKAIDKGVNGIIATNTSIDYSLVVSPREVGGLSGKVLKLKSREVLLELARAFFGKTVLISTGGISDGEEAYERIKLGASLVQAFTGLIFKGPYLCKSIGYQIEELLRRDGFLSIKDAIGVDIK